MRICPAAVAKDLSTSDFEQCFFVCVAGRARASTRTPGRLDNDACAVREALQITCFGRVDPSKTSVRLQDSLESLGQAVTLEAWRRENLVRTEGFRIRGSFLGPPGRLRVPWAAPGPLPGSSRPQTERQWAVLGRSRESLGPLWVALGPLLECPGRLVGLSWASFGGSGAALGSQIRCFAKTQKTMFFHALCTFLGCSGGPPGTSWRPWGPLLAAQGRPQ